MKFDICKLGQTIDWTTIDSCEHFINLISKIFWQAQFQYANRNKYMNMHNFYFFFSLIRKISSIIRHKSTNDQRNYNKFYWNKAGWNGCSVRFGKLIFTWFSKLDSSFDSWVNHSQIFNIVDECVERSHIQINWFKRLKISTKLLNKHVF